MLTTVLRLEASARTGCAMTPLEIGVSERIPYLDRWLHYRSRTAACSPSGEVGDKRALS